MPLAEFFRDIANKELDRETTTKFLEACEQFERIMNDSGLVLSLIHILCSGEHKNPSGDGLGKYLSGLRAARHRRTLLSGCKVTPLKRYRTDA